MENKLSKVFDLRLIRMDLKGKTKDLILVELIDLITDLHPECNRTELITKITEREKKMSTGIGNGVAIPHAFCGGINNMIGAIGISRQGIDYGALDNNLVHIVFLLAMKQQADENHLRILNLITRLVQSESLALIKSAKTAEEIHEILSRIH